MIYVSCLQAVVRHWLSIHVVTVTRFIFDSYAIGIAISKINWIKVEDISDNEVSSQSCFIIIVLKTVFLCQYEQLFLQDIDPALTSVIVWPNYMISDYHTQIILEK